MSLIKGARNLDNARLFVDWVLSKDAQELAWKKGKSYQILTNTTAETSPNSLKLDDPVGAIQVHLFNGIWGTLAVGIFAVDKITGAATGIGASMSLALVGAGHLMGIAVGIAMATGLAIAWGVAVPVLTHLYPAAGDAAYRYIARGVELALEGQIVAELRVDHRCGGVRRCLRRRGPFRG